MKAAKIIAWKNFTLHAPALAFLIALSLALSSCGALPLDNAGASGAGAEQPMSEAELEAVAAVDEDYDFSMFFGHSEDAITIGRIVERYKAATGISVKPIMTDEGAADDRLLQRYLSAADPPAAFALSADAEGSVAYAVGGGYVEPSVSDTTGESFRTPTQASQGGVLAYAETGAASSPAGIGWRFRGRGLAADRRMLADLIGAADADSAEVGAFIEDLRLSGYEEWDAFIAGLDAYIQGAAYGAITLNGKAYSFAAEKGRRSSQLNGVFAVRGAEYPFFSEWMMDLAAITSVDEGLRQAR
ncbi:MAG: hypothetical protein LBG82_01390, partial [Clostridiales Family XIII bacterium]|nr:hypothetical protein [Clostridiales Family XIII bacterium]